MAPEVYGCECGQGEAGEQQTSSGEHAPRGAGVSDMNKVEETIDDGDGVRWSVGAERESVVDPDLGDLVEREKDCGNKPECAIGADALAERRRGRRRQRGCRVIRIGRPA